MRFGSALVGIVASLTIGMATGAAQQKPLSAGDLTVPDGVPYRTVTISEPRQVAADLAIPWNVSLRFENGGCLHLAEGVTLKIDGSLEAPLQRIFSGAGKVVFGRGRVDKVYPQWWGARGDEAADDTEAIQAAIDSIERGIVFFPAGDYANRGVVARSWVTLQGAGPGASCLVFTPSEGSCVTLPVECSGFRLEDLSLRATRENNGYGINGTDEYVRYFSMKNFFVTGFKTGIYIAQGMHISLEYGYIGCYGMGAANGTVGLKLGDKALNKGCTTATISDVYFTNAETDFYNRAAPCLLIRPIFETCQVGLDSYTRAIIVAPFMEGCQKADARFTDNGALFIGVSAAHYKFIYEDDTIRSRTSWIPDTFDCPMKIGPLNLDHHGRAGIEVEGKVERIAGPK